MTPLCFRDAICHLLESEIPEDRDNSFSRNFAICYRNARRHIPLRHCREKLKSQFYLRGSEDAQRQSAYKTKQ